MRRREFITVLGGAATWPLAAHAQPSEKVRRVGVLIPYAEADPEASLRVSALREALLKLGWTENRNIRFEHRWFVSDTETIPKLAREIVDSRPDVILADTTVVTGAPRDAHYPCRLRSSRRSGRQRVRCELSAPWRQCHRV